MLHQAGGNNRKGNDLASVLFTGNAKLTFLFLQVVISAKNPSEASSATAAASADWQWGELPSAAPASQQQHGPLSNKAGLKKEHLKSSKSVNQPSSSSDAAQKKESEEKRQRTWTFSFWSAGGTAAGSGKDGATEEEAKKERDARKAKEESPGIYLDDLKDDDQEMLSLYVGSGRHEQPSAAAAASAPRTDTIPVPGASADDDAESGNGPSLPMSPHSVEGAIGGRNSTRAASYDSGGEEDNRAVRKVLPDIAISLCGGLGAVREEVEDASTLTEGADVATASPAGAAKDPAAAEADAKATEDAAASAAAAPKDSAAAAPSAASTPVRGFSTALFEAAIVSYDDFAMRLRNGDQDFFENPNLVVRIGDQYYTWKAACPIVMSAVLYGRSLPSDLVKVGSALLLTLFFHEMYFLSSLLIRSLLPCR